MEDQTGTDPGTPCDDTLARGVSAEKSELFRELPQRLDQSVKLTAGQEFIESAETEQDALLDLAVNPLVIDDEEVSSGTVGLSANEQSGAPVPLL